MLVVYQLKKLIKKYLIGLYLGKHDANVSLYNGNRFVYYKPERNLQIKHVGFQLDSGKQYHKNYKDCCIEIFNYLKISKDQIEAIAISDSAWDSVVDDKYKSLDELKDICEKVYFVDHHYSHFLSDFSSKNAWVYDGHGNNLDYSKVIQENEISECLKDPEDGYSFGWCLEQFGRKVTGAPFGAGNVMAFDSLGQLNQEYYYKYRNYPLSLSYIYQSFKNFYLSHSKQKFQTEIYYDYAKTLHEIIKYNHVNYLKKFFSINDHFLFTGGVSQSIVLNTHLKKCFKNIKITPHGYDGGISLGLINFLVRMFNWDLPKIDNFPFIQHDEHPGLPSKSTITKTAEFLAQGKIVLWYQGNGELGPRALGNRSILANPAISNMKEKINEKVKKRAWYRPYGASVLKENYKEYFELDWDSPYMLYQACVKDQETFKSITHFDGTCRIQTVESSHEYFYELLDNFKRLTGFPILLNTSLNLPGNPIAGRKQDALSIFNNSEAEVLVVGDEILEK